LTEDEKYELKIATLLHDCGKVTTPVHIVDKATKLEKIFDRIDLIKTRVEVLRRDAWLKLLREKIAALEDGQPFDEEAAEQRLAAFLRQLDADKEVLRTCNIGSEYMPPAMQDQIREISERYRWINPDGVEEAFLSEDEVNNLMVQKGTLTQEDREIINYHIVATINMLESLKFPARMRNVGKYAGAHHERNDGSGYPRGLQGGDIPIQARIMAVADVFEALTAKDRPYKEAIRLSQALQILEKLRDDGKLDRDVVDLFIREKVYMRYAEQYLDPEQIDIDLMSEFRGDHPE
ncbi:MAG: HD-GYP domain-containing protein, partial [Myxococcota bacterium]